LYFSIPVERATDCIDECRRQMGKGARRGRVHETDHPLPTQSVATLRKGVPQISYDRFRYRPRSWSLRNEIWIGMTLTRWLCLRSDSSPFPRDHVHLAQRNWRYEYSTQQNVLATVGECRVSYDKTADVTRCESCVESCCVML
jgi:hypothetical protein